MRTEVEDFIWQQGFVPKGADDTARFENYLLDSGLAYDPGDGFISVNRKMMSAAELTIYENLGY